MEAIIIAGGKGTRLKTVINDMPKPMAPVNNRPFLSIIFDQLIAGGIKSAVLAVGYKWEQISAYYGNKYKTLDLQYAVEKTPLGTGGAIKNAVQYIKSGSFFTLNGDTFFDVDFNELMNFHKNKNADLSLSLKAMQNFDRYGSVKIDSGNKIIAFEEKQFKENGYINGGIYCMNKNIFDIVSGEKFSFEKDLMEAKLNELNIYGKVFDKYFIDIGIPEDYEKAKEYFFKVK